MNSRGAVAFLVGGQAGGVVGKVRPSSRERCALGPLCWSSNFRSRPACRNPCNRNQIHRSPSLQVTEFPVSIRSPWRCSPAQSSHLGMHWGASASTSSERRRPVVSRRGALSCTEWAVGCRGVIPAWVRRSSASVRVRESGAHWVPQGKQGVKSSTPVGVLSANAERARFCLIDGLRRSPRSRGGRVWRKQCNRCLIHPTGGRASPTGCPDVEVPTSQAGRDGAVPGGSRAPCDFSSADRHRSGSNRFAVVRSP